MTGVRSLPRPSMRVLVALLVLAITVAPLFIVITWLGVESLAEAAMKRNARESVAEILQGRGANDVAARRRVRIELVDRSGVVIEDHDFDRVRDLTERASGFVLGSLRQRESRELDAVFGRVAERPEFRAALEHGSAEGCRDVADSDLVACYSASTLPAASTLVVFAQDGSERLLAPLYELRRWLGRLTLVILPFAALLAVWSGRRIVVPIERLRAEVLAKVREPRPKPGLFVPRASELADLASAFDNAARTSRRARSRERGVRRGSGPRVQESRRRHPRRGRHAGILQCRRCARGAYRAGAPRQLAAPRRARHPVPEARPGGSRHDR